VPATVQGSKRKRTGLSAHVLPLSVSRCLENRRRSVLHLPAEVNGIEAECSKSVTYRVSMALTFLASQGEHKHHRHRQDRAGEI
jgi:hypothetical protein